jgi:hypothetical protein
MTAHGLPDHCIYTECSDEADEASDKTLTIQKMTP